MIGKLKGKVDEISKDHIILDTGGVGYEIYCSASTIDNLTLNEGCSLYTVTHVREDHIHLYGFITYIEKEFFGLLQSVNGIGARMALAILSALTPAQIQQAIVNKDKESFKSVSGVGAKIAERIVLELKDKTKNLSPDFIYGSELVKNHPFISSKTQDAMYALTGLGINKANAQTIIDNIIAKEPDIELDELIRAALKQRNS